MKRLSIEEVVKIFDSEHGYGDGYGYTGMQGAGSGYDYIQTDGSGEGTDACGHESGAGEGNGDRYAYGQSFDWEGCGEESPEDVISKKPSKLMVMI